MPVTSLECGDVGLVKPARVPVFVDNAALLGASEAVVSFTSCGTTAVLPASWYGGEKPQLSMSELAAVELGPRDRVIPASPDSRLSNDILTTGRCHPLPCLAR